MGKPVNVERELLKESLARLQGLVVKMSKQLKEQAALLKEEEIVYESALAMSLEEKQALEKQGFFCHHAWMTTDSFWQGTSFEMKRALCFGRAPSKGRKR